MADFRPGSDVLADLMRQNRAWKKSVDEKEPQFFEHSANNPQKPKILWIGCSDSRVPESVILDCMPGEIFTHRNIANQVQLNDPNGISVLTYAVASVGVEHIIVAGHTRCGGVCVCVDNASAAERAECFGVENGARVFGPTEPRETSQWPPPAPIDAWLAPLRELALSHPPGPSSSNRVDQIAMANVRQQVVNVIQSEAVRNAWVGRGPGRLVGVHGWMYHLEDGLVQDLGCSIVHTADHATPYQ